MCFPNSVYVMCIHHLLNLASRSESDPGIINLRRTAYAKTKQAFEAEKEKLKDYQDAFRKLQSLDGEQWVF